MTNLVGISGYLILGLHSDILTNTIPYEKNNEFDIFLGGGWLLLSHFKAFNEDHSC